MRSMAQCIPASYPDGVVRGWARAWTRRWVSLALALTLAGTAAAQSSREYDVKAVFLYNFATFVDWPDGALAAGQPFTVAVLGKDPFGPVLERITSGEKVKGHPFAVHRCRTAAEARGCQVVFISSSEAARLPEILRVFRGRPVLTVADMPHFLEAGGVI